MIPLDPVAKSTQDDKRLERLYDYTKFHIGIYLSAAGGLVALIGTLAKNQDKFAELRALIGAPPFLGLALACIILAGGCAGIVATAVTESKTFEDFWGGAQGPSWWAKGPRGARWVAAEHFFFWLSLVFVLLAVLANHNVLVWLTAFAPSR